MGHTPVFVMLCKQAQNDAWATCLSAGTVDRQYTYGLQRISENQVISNAWTASFYGYDGSGNVRQLTNAVGAVTDTNEYDAFGNLVNFTGTTPNRYLYRGEQYDSDLSLYYLRARYYNPGTGEFMSRDPNDGDIEEPTTLHKYLYASAYPVNRVDPAGRAAIAVEVDIEEEEELEVFAPEPPPPPPGGIDVTGAVGIYLLADAISCAYYTDAAGVKASVQHLGYITTINLIAQGCSAMSKGSGMGSGPEPEPEPEPQPQPAPGPGKGPKPPPPPPCKCPPGWDKHHLLPQQFRAWFIARPRFLNVDNPQFLVCIPREDHQGLHSNQGGVGGTHWNARWAQFMTQYPYASAQQVLNFLTQMEQQFGMPNMSPQYCKE